MQSLHFKMQVLKGQNLILLAGDSISWLVQRESTGIQQRICSIVTLAASHNRSAHEIRVFSFTAVPWFYSGIIPSKPRVH